MTKYCAWCNRHRNAEGGVTKRKGGKGRFRCAECHEKMTGVKKSVDTKGGLE